METTTRHGAIEGKTQHNETNYYNLDAIISVGYRINSKKATQFRIWATSLKSDVPMAKNYLDEKQIRQLERTVTGYFDYIEDLIERENVFTMEEFSESVNAFSEFRRYDILKDNGKISHAKALEKAYSEYEIFNKTQKISSDFDKFIQNIKSN